MRMLWSGRFGLSAGARLSIVWLAIAWLAWPVLPARADVMAEIAERGTLRVGTAFNIPWAMHDAAGEPFGFEVDNAARLASDLGVELELVPLPFGELLDALDWGTVDVVAAGVSITPERALLVAFSDPYMIGDVGAVVRVADLDRHPDLLAFDDPEVTAAAVAGTTTELALARTLPLATAEIYDNVGDAIRAFLEGRATLLVAETPVPELLLAENPEVFTILPEALLSTAQAFAVRRGEHTFLTFLDNWITAYEVTGVLDSARAYWFGGRDWLARLEAPLIEMPIDGDEEPAGAD
jgi:polar amino acid transport system substrate-binding protein